MVLTGLPAGERVPLSEVRARPHRWVSRPRLVEVLTDLDLLHDDSIPAIRSWVDHVTSHLTPGFINPVRQWLLVLLDGDTRSRPRSASSIHVYFSCVRPFLDDWVARYDHLREVTRSDIGAALGPLSGSRRATTTNAMRSLYRHQIHRRRRAPARRRTRPGTQPRSRLKSSRNPPEKGTGA